MKQIKCNHIGIHCVGVKKTDLFFEKILGMPKVRDYIISSELSEKLFGVDKETIIHTFDNGKLRLEVFISESNNQKGYSHVSIEVEDIPSFLENCKKVGLEVRHGKTEDGKNRDLWFVNDFSNNLYEIKELWD